jgi:hypothetical protein
LRRGDVSGGGTAEATIGGSFFSALAEPRPTALGRGAAGLLGRDDAAATASSAPAVCDGTPDGSGASGMPTTFEAAGALGPGVTAAGAAP